MTFDPRSPVIVGAGQVLQRAGSVAEAAGPLDLMASAVEAAAIDAGLAGVPDGVDSIRVVNTLSWRFGDPATLLAEQLGIATAQAAYTYMGGNTPQSLVNATARDIAAGRLDVAVLAGGEAWRTRMRARKEAITLDWPKSPAGTEPSMIGSEMEMTHPVEAARGIFLPVQMYPIFETAWRAATGRDPETHLADAAALWSRFSEVAAENPFAWSPLARSADDIRSARPDNRMVGYPYTKAMNSNNDVDMAAALVVCSARWADDHGIASDRWVFVHSGSDCHEHPFVSNRWAISETPAIRRGGALALELAGVGIDDIALVDLYSCFPSAVQIGAAALGLPIADPARPLTRTGGLSFAGGPWNNYVMHAIATMVGDLRSRAGSVGLIWGNGGYLTKHSFGVYGTEPPAAGFRFGSPQAEIDGLASRELAVGADAAGAATIEGYTVMHGRDGAPELAVAPCLRADGRRAWGTSADTDLMAALLDGEWVGRDVTLDATGTLHA